MPVLIAKPETESNRYLATISKNRFHKDLAIVLSIAKFWLAIVTSSILIAKYQDYS